MAKTKIYNMSILSSLLMEFPFSTIQLITSNSFLLFHIHNSLVTPGEFTVLLYKYYILLNNPLYSFFVTPYTNQCAGHSSTNP